jgi:hypothetical protein
LSDFCYYITQAKKYKFFEILSPFSAVTGVPENHAVLPGGVFSSEMLNDQPQRRARNMTGTGKKKEIERNF